MAFTKITHAGIGSTGTVLLENLEVTGVGTFGGSVSVGGTLTYEDVTNIDSVGLITARNGIVVGSGITLSKDGDIFFTGIATGNGSGLTALNASNISSGTVPTARLGSGTASSSTFLRGDSTFAAVTSTTINSNADNRVITGSGTANTLNGEANLAFDGTGLGLVGHIDIRTGSSINTNVTGGSASGTLHKNTTSGEFAVVSGGTGGNNYLTFFTSASAAPTEKFRINHQGRITTPLGTSTKIGIADRTSGTGAGGSLLITAGAARGSSQTTGDLLLAAGRGNNSADNGVIRFGYSDGSDGIGLDQEHARIDSSGRLLIATTSSSQANTGADDLVVGNTSQGNNGMTLVTGNANNGAFFFADQDGAVRGGVRYQHGSDLSQFYAGGDVVLNLKNKGVGINETSPIADALVIRGGDTDDTPRLILKRATDGTQVDGEIIGKLQFMSNENNVDSGNYQPRVEIHGVTVSTSGAAKMDFYTVPNSTTTPVKRMTIDQTGVVTIPNQPSFSAHTTTTGSANADVVFGAAVTNIGSHYSTGNGRFTAPVAGNYFFSFHGMGPHADTNNIRCYFKINGAAHGGGQHYGGVAYAGAHSGGYTHISMSTILPLSANDYVQVYWQNTSMHSEHCKFNGFLIG